jgi:probable HAF family extracellular repeat protein
MYVNGINNAGKAVGASYGTVNGQFGLYPVIWTGTVPAIINSTPLIGSAKGINDYDQITIGVYVFKDGQLTPITTDNNAYAVFGGPINRAGQITGGTSHLHHAFLYANGAAKDLGTLSTNSYSLSAGLGINNAGQVVGVSNPGGDSMGLPCYTSAFLYSNGQMSNLNSLVDAGDPLKPFVCLFTAVAINDSGLIAANGADTRTNLINGYLLTPTAPFPASVQLYALPSSAIVGVPLTVSWTNQNVTACTASGGTPGDGWGGPVPSNGGQVPVTETAVGPVTYSISCNGAAGLVTASASVSVAAPPSVTLTASPTAVLTGQRVTLTWSSVSVTSCTATGGSGTDLWHANQPTSGTLSLIEGSAGVYPFGLSCMYGTQTYTAQAPVTVNWPAVRVTLTASPTTINLAQPTTLTWSAPNATNCNASGGGAGDNWPGGKPPTGHQSVSEPYTPSGASLTLTFTLSCTSDASGHSGQAAVKVTQTNLTSSPSTSGNGGGGGGGAVDLWAGLGLCCLGINRLRAGRRLNRYRPPPAPIH